MTQKINYLERIKAFTIKIITPSAFKVGVLLTLSMLYLAFQFYHSSVESKKNPLMNFLNQAYDKSVDFRMLARGERLGSPDVVLITVDETAVEKLGRWPWPRKMIAETIQKLLDAGAKVIGFDAIFSEPDNNQAVISLQKLKRSQGITLPMQALIDQELSQANSDQILADTVKKYADRIVIGTYFDKPVANLYPYQEFCDNLRIKETQTYKYFETDDRPIAVIESQSEEPNEFFSQFIQTEFKKIAEDLTKEHGMVKDASDQMDLENKIVYKKIEYCANWLNEKNDVSWNRLKQSYETIAAKTTELQKVSFSDYVHFFRDGFLRNEVERAGRWWSNLDSVQKEVKNNSYFNAFLDGDGTIRRTGLIERNGDQYIASLALKTAMIALNRGALLKLSPSVADIGAKDVTELGLTDTDTGNVVETIPVDKSGQLVINYAGHQKMFAHMSVYELFNGKDTATIEIRRDSKHVKETVRKAEYIKNKIFLFGATATGIYDLRVTPFEENYPGLETHANVVDNIIRKDYLRKTNDEEPKMMLFILISGILISFLLSRVGAIVGLATTITILISISLIDKFYIFKAGYLINIILPLFLTFFLYVALTFYKYFTEERNKKALRGTFSKYVSPAIVDEILKNPNNIKLGGRKERMTVLFSDIRGFTTISEKLSPNALSDFLNSYLTPMTDLVFSNKGTLDKYMGDAVMAFFGAPISYKEHAQMACRCALQMMEKLKALQPVWQAQGLPPLDIGIGINTGEMCVGNMGSETVRSYTVMGDSVNLGSRLEGINKQYETHVIISEFVYEDVKDLFYCRELDWVKVKGKHLPVKIYELIAEKSKPLDEKTLQMLDYFDVGFKSYHKKNFAGAQEQFQQALNLNSADGPTKLYVERCQDYQQEPPPENWDGVYTMKTK